MQCSRPALARGLLQELLELEKGGKEVEGEEAHAGWLKDPARADAVRWGWVGGWVVWVGGWVDLGQLSEWSLLFFGQFCGKE